MDRLEIKKQLHTEYTEFYSVNGSDSAKGSRSFLIEEIISNSQALLKQKQRVRILDLGSGKQILESELQEQPSFKDIQGKVDIITVDLADINSEQLFTPEHMHIQASGDALPFIDEFFDFVVSSSALDFMPKAVFPEIYRILRTQGQILTTFHHESLITAAKGKMRPAMKRLHTVEQKLRHGKNSSKKEKWETKLKAAHIEIKDIRFVLNVLPDLIFRSTAEIEAELSRYGFVIMQLFEQQQTLGENGWYFAHAKKVSHL